MHNKLFNHEMYAECCISVPKKRRKKDNDYDDLMLVTVSLVPKEEVPEEKRKDIFEYFDSPAHFLHDFVYTNQEDNGYKYVSIERLIPQH